MCNKSASSSELSFSWDKPPQLEQDVTSYQVEVKELKHKNTAKEIVLVDVADVHTNMEEQYIQGLSEQCIFNPRCMHVQGLQYSRVFVYVRMR